MKAKTGLSVLMGTMAPVPGVSEVVEDLRAMPHMLVAGTTGSGKSTFLRTLITGLVDSESPETVKLLLIDPKGTEFSVFDGIPHLYNPAVAAAVVGIVRRPEAAVQALGALVRVMEARFAKFAYTKAQDIEAFNKTAEKPEPYVVVVVDELADLMAASRRPVEASLRRLTHMGRAAGIHLILATQRPSVDVLTGTIKANVPCRVAFRVTSWADSNVILDCRGAERLAGPPEMIYKGPANKGFPLRLYAPTVKTEKIVGIMDDLRRSSARPSYEIDAIARSQDFPDQAVRKVAELILATKKPSYTTIRETCPNSAMAESMVGSLEELGLIKRKPKGWEADFDKITAYLHGWA